MTVRAARTEAAKAAEGTKAIADTAAAIREETAELRKITARILDEMAELKGAVSGLASVHPADAARPPLLPLMNEYVESVSRYAASAGDRDVLEQHRGGMKTAKEPGWANPMVSPDADPWLVAGHDAETTPQVRTPTVANSKKTMVAHTEERLATKPLAKPKTGPNPGRWERTHPPNRQTPGMAPTIPRKQGLEDDGYIGYCGIRRDDEEKSQPGPVTPSPGLRRYPTVRLVPRYGQDGRLQDYDRVVVTSGDEQGTHGPGYNYHLAPQPAQQPTARPGGARLPADDTIVAPTKPPKPSGPIPQASLELVEADSIVDGWVAAHRLCAVRADAPTERRVPQTEPFRLVPLPGSRFSGNPPRIQCRPDRLPGFHGHSAYSPDGKLMAWSFATSSGRGVNISNFPPLEQPVERFIGWSDGVSAVDFSPNSVLLAAAGQNMLKITVLKQNEGAQFSFHFELPTQGIQVERVMFSPDGSRLASLGRSVLLPQPLPHGNPQHLPHGEPPVMVQVWSVESQALIHQFMMPNEAMVSSSQSTTGCFVCSWGGLWVVACWNRQSHVLSVYNLAAGTLFRTIELLGPTLVPPEFKPDDLMGGFTMTSAGGTVRAAVAHSVGGGQCVVDVWDVEKETCLCTMGPFLAWPPPQPHAFGPLVHIVESMSFSPDMQHLAITTRFPDNFPRTQFWRIPGTLPVDIASVEAEGSDIASAEAKGSVSKPDDGAKRTSQKGPAPRLTTWKRLLS